MWDSSVHSFGIVEEPIRLMAAAVHIDGLLERPMVVMDGETVVSDGRIRL